MTNAVTIPNSTVCKVLDDLTFANGPGVQFVLIGIKDGQRPAMMTTLTPESVDELMLWLLERREDKEITPINMEDDSFKKGH